MKLITANHLKTGRVIYYQVNPEGWTAIPRRPQRSPTRLPNPALQPSKRPPGTPLAPTSLPFLTAALEAKSGGEKACATAAQAPEPLGFSRRARLMYRYREDETALVLERIEEFEDQIARRLSGELSEDAFKPLRLMNGLYLQLHAYMLRVAIPYGTLDTAQLRALAHIAERFDRGYGHFTTRQNLQFNWIALTEVPEILRELATVGLHAIQTSGNCIRNVTADPFAGAAADELEDSRPWAELLRQWSTFHPEFSFLPRKFKIAVNGAREDRTALRFHDIGLQWVKGPEGTGGFEVWVGGGQGRTPRVGRRLRRSWPRSICSAT